MTPFAQALLRTSRAALRQRANIHPLQQAFGLEGGAQYVNACRAYATVFERNKPHVNIGQSYLRSLRCSSCTHSSLCRNNWAC